MLNIHQVILSYMIQLSVALINLLFTALYRFLRTHRYQKQGSTATRSNRQGLPDADSISPDTIASENASPHLQNFLRYLSDFHKLQCYYAITLQIATLIALYGPSTTTHSIRNPFDEAFLLLLSINGILPVSIMLYSLALVGDITIYDICLTSLSAILASDTGITIVNFLSQPHNSGKGTRGSYIDWPAATGGLAPETICGRRYKIRYPKKLTPEKVFLVGTVLCDGFLIGLIIWWILATYYPHKTSKLSAYLQRHRWCTRPSWCLPPPNRSPVPSETKPRSRSGKIADRAAQSAGHISAAIIFIFATGMEYFCFYQMLVPQYDRIVDFRDWGFGQIVGIAVWAVVFIDLARHEIGMYFETATKRKRIDKEDNVARIPCSLFLVCVWTY